MSISVPPPDYQFTGLFYNPSFWIHPTDGLTQDAANQLYLRKTVTDSASALETFNGGIRTNDLNTTSPTNNLTIASSLTTGNVNIMTGASTAGQLNIGNSAGTTVMNINGTIPININNGVDCNTYDVITAGTTKNFFNTQTAAVNILTNMAASASLQIGNPTIGTQPCKISQLNIAGITINNAVAPGNGGIEIGSTQTGTGTLNLGAASTRTGAVNIASGASTANTSTINLSSASSLGIIRANRPLTLGYIPSDITTGSASLQIGNRYAPTLSSTTATLGSSVFNMCSWTTPIGVWIYEVNFFVSTNTGVSRVDFYVSNVSNTADASRAGGGNTEVGQGGYMNASGVIVNSASSTWYLVGFSIGASSVINIAVNLTRIA